MQKLTNMDHGLNVKSKIINFFLRKKHKIKSLGSRLRERILSFDIKKHNP